MRVLLVASLSTVVASSAFAGSLFGPKQKIEQTNQKAVEDVQSTAAEKLNRVITGEKTPVRPVVPMPQANVTLRGDGNIYLAPENRAPERSTDEIYEEFLERKRIREEFERYKSAGMGTYREEVSYQSNSGAGATSNKESSEYQKWSIPLGWNLILLGIGACLLLFVFNRLRNTSAAFNQLYLASDGIIGNWIKQARERAQTTGDPAEMNRLNAEMVDMESARGKLLTEKTKLKP
ncbi:MAG TPA: hypothetical protein VGH19_06645 [Verrucomicrobiae bacterium]